MQKTDLDNYVLKFETSAHLNLDEINHGLNINYTQVSMKESLSQVSYFLISHAECIIITCGFSYLQYRFFLLTLILLFET